MKGQFCFTIKDVETKIDGMPIKIGEVSIVANDERSAWDMLIISRLIKALPKWMSRLYSEISKMEKLS